MIMVRMIKPVKCYLLYVHVHPQHSHTHSSLHSSYLILVITVYLTHESVELQKLAANSDRLISEYLQQQLDENNDLVRNWLE